MKLSALILAGFLLAGCAAFGSAKDKAYEIVAEKGNSYCETRDPEAVKALLERVNAGIAEAGGTFHLEGAVVC